MCSRSYRWLRKHSLHLGIVSLLLLAISVMGPPGAYGVSYDRAGRAYISGQDRGDDKRDRVYLKIVARLQYDHYHKDDG